MPPKNPPDMQPYVPTDPRYALPTDETPEGPKPADAPEPPKIAEPAFPEEIAKPVKENNPPKLVETGPPPKFTLSVAFFAGIEAILHPSRNTRRTFEEREVLTNYYKSSIVPIIIFFCLGLYLLTSPTYAIGINTAIIVSSGAQGLLGFAAIIIVSLLLLNPIRIVLDSYIVDYFGKKVIKAFKQDYKNTMSAMFYSIMPPTFLCWMPLIAVALYYWLVIPGLHLGFSTYALPKYAAYVPTIMAAAFFIIYGWSLIVSTFALSNQQKVSKHLAFLVVCLSGVISLAVILIFGLAVGYALHTNAQQISSFIYQFL
jgi:hypothetical protein